MELPTISKSSYAASTYDPGVGLVGAVGAAQWEGDYMGDSVRGLDRRIAPQVLDQVRHPGAAIAQFIKEKVMPSARIVRVFVVDPNENLTLNERVIYKSDEMLTDLTDQELFFEANPAALLVAHNELRVKTIDKRASERANKNVFLEPARIRDLKMVVVDVASF